MNYWNFYFITKAIFFYYGYISFQWIPNFLIFIILATSAKEKIPRKFRVVGGFFLGLVLLYHESYLPTPGRIFSQIKALSGFSTDYMLELALRIINPAAITISIIAIFTYSIASRKIRFSSIAFASIISIPIAGLLSNTKEYPIDVEANALSGSAEALKSLDPDTLLRNFYANESQKKLQIKTTGMQPDFDIILLHICSLSWDDLDFIGQRDHSYLKKFDLLFTNFNSAASYSGPASMRVLHGSCGQTEHKKLYDGIDPQCYIFPQLEKIGYRTTALLNHNGLYEDFSITLEQKGGLAGKIEKNTSAPIHMQNFDGSPIYNDYSVLAEWWKKRVEKKLPASALYYNSISLHDGNRIPGISSRSSLDTFKPRLMNLFSDFDKFILDLEKSGRPVVLIMIPEHGASLRGDKIQISGMREIPGPKITLVPAALKIIGLKKTDQEKTNPIIINKQTSYFDMFNILNELIQDNPYFEKSTKLVKRVEKIGTTEFVSENLDVIVMRNKNEKFILKSGNNDWINYSN